MDTVERLCQLYDEAAKHYREEIIAKRKVFAWRWKETMVWLETRLVEQLGDK